MKKSERVKVVPRTKVDESGMWHGRWRLLSRNPISNNIAHGTLNCSID